MSEQVSSKVINQLNGKPKTELDGVPTKEHWELYKAHYNIPAIKTGKLFGSKINLGDAFQAFRDSKRADDDKEKLWAIMESYTKNLYKKDKLKKNTKNRVIQDLQRIQLEKLRVVDNENKSLKKKKVHDIVMDDGVTIVNFVPKKNHNLVIVDEHDYDDEGIVDDVQDDEGIVDDVLNHVTDDGNGLAQDEFEVKGDDDNDLNHVTDGGNGLAQDEFEVKGDDENGNNNVTLQSINIHRSSSIYWC
jgi:hypothetical protein